MTIIVFLIDTSASMSARCYLGTRLSFLDLAKEAVETFIKVRQRSPESRGDRYMLLSFEDPPHNIKAGWKENLDAFMYELRNLKSYTLTTMGKALKHTFDLLNVNRVQSGIDTYGQGRCPFYLEPSVIILVTDGGKLNNFPDFRVTENNKHLIDRPIDAGILPTVLKHEEGVKYPKVSCVPGYEMTTEPYRWDQRVFSLVLRLPGTPAMGHHFGLVPPDNSPIDNVCEATGGRSYCVTSYRILMQCVDSIVQKVQTGVVINLEKFSLDPTLPEAKHESQSQINPRSYQDALFQRGGRPVPMAAWHKCRKQIYVDRSGHKGVPGYWPIPESYWPDNNTGVLPPRTAHPKVMFSCTNQEPMLLEDVPVDKYELEPSPLTLFLLAKKQPMVCWQTFVMNSSNKFKAGYPFGYLKANLNLTHVYLFVMPYNYPVLLPLLDELFKGVKIEKNTGSNVSQRTAAVTQPPNMVHRPSYEWRTQFHNYMKTIPPYYYAPLKRVLRQKGIGENLVQALIPDSLDSYLSFPVVSYLKHIKKAAKAEFERICNTVRNTNRIHNTVCRNAIQVIDPNPSLKKETVTHPVLKSVFKNDMEMINDCTSGFVVGVQQLGRKQLTSGYIPRDQLVGQYFALRDKVLNVNYRAEQDGEAQHNRPVNQMGNYQEYLKGSTPPLRPIEATAVRYHMFGNPFKIDKNMMVDEADIYPTARRSPVQSPKHSSPRDSSPQRPQKRKYEEIAKVG